MPKQILLCPPDYFDIEYEINPWMHQDEQPTGQTARQQWQQLYDIYSKDLGWKVELIEPVNHLPDMVFATDCAMVLDDKVFLGHFRYPERRPETGHYEHWLRAHGYQQIKKSIYFWEGGDILSYGNRILAGFGFRTNLAAHREMARYFDRQVISLGLVNPNFYHLDTALAVLSDNTVAYYPEAFDLESRNLLQALVPNLIEVTAEEATGFGLNAVSDGRHVITSDASLSLLDKFRAGGFEVYGTPILEFRKAGGGINCLTLRLNF